MKKNIYILLLFFLSLYFTWDSLCFSSKSTDYYKDTGKPKITGIPVSKSNDAVSKIKKYIRNGAVVLSDIDGEDILSINRDKYLVPASIQKIITSLISLYVLKPDYRFKTEFYMDTGNNLFIKGYGDPSLVSEELNKITLKLKSELNGKNINNIYVDDSYFKSGTDIPGRSNTNNPYDARIGALSVNFNTILIRRLTSGEYISGEIQTPLTGFAKKIAEKQFLKKGLSMRINLGDNVDYPEIYFGHLFREFLIINGVKVNGRILKTNLLSLKTAPTLLMTHWSDKDLVDIIKDMLEYSNNFTANQLFMKIGAVIYGPPASLSKSRKTVQEYLERFSLYKTNLVEGSGISRQNYTTADDFKKVLQIFFKYKFLIPYSDSVYSKTGTLRNVNSLSGFYKSKLDNKWKLFVIILNQKKNNTRKILDILKKYF